jgi:hypothetical protein
MNHALTSRISAIFLTYTRQPFDLLRPDPDLVNALDIAHGLATLPGFVGQASVQYTAAERAVLLSEMVDDDAPLAALLCGAASAYVGVVAPAMKVAMRRLCDLDRRCAEGVARSHHDRLEDGVRRAICEKFGVTEVLPPSVVAAATELSCYEEHVFLGTTTDQPCAEVKIEFLSPSKAVEAYLSRYCRITGRTIRGLYLTANWSETEQHPRDVLHRLKGRLDG